MNVQTLWSLNYKKLSNILSRPPSMPGIEGHNQVIRKLIMWKKTFTVILGSEEEAIKFVYYVFTERHYGFGILNFMRNFCFEVSTQWILNIPNDHNNNAWFWFSILAITYQLQNSSTSSNSSVWHGSLWGDCE